MMFVIRLDSPSPGQAWQAMYAAAGYDSSMGKVVIAVDSDVEPSDLGSVVWALAYSTQPRCDVQILDGRLPRLDPSMPLGPDAEAAATASALLINATRSHSYPPTSLPLEQYMRGAVALWQRLGLPRLQLQEPWHGYELGEWTAENREEAALAVLGRYLETGRKLSM